MTRKQQYEQLIRRSGCQDKKLIDWIVEHVMALADTEIAEAEYRVRERERSAPHSDCRKYLDRLAQPESCKPAVSSHNQDLYKA